MQFAFGEAFGLLDALLMRYIRVEEEVFHQRAELLLAAWHRTKCSCLQRVAAFRIATVAGFSS